MTEFAVVLPILAVLLFGIIQFGITFKDYLSLTDAVRAGARKAAVSRNASNPVGTTRTAVRNAAADLDPAKLPDPDVVSSWQAGTDVKVTAQYPYRIQLFGIPVMSGNLKSSMTERVE
ncbi:MAG: pilus assembly protein [Actinomycetota bacterium]|nr:pilus assembly protein [Actinomycetota bacterium]